MHNLVTSVGVHSHGLSDQVFVSTFIRPTVPVCLSVFGMLLLAVSNGQSLGKMHTHNFLFHLMTILAK